MYIGLHVTYRYSCPILMKLEFSRQIFEKFSNIKFNKNVSSWSRVVPFPINIHTDTTNLIFVFRYFANAPNKPHFVYTKHKI